MSFALTVNSIKYIKQEKKSVFFKPLLSMVLLLSTLFLSLNATALMVSRGPYLQTETSSSIILRWRTDTATDSVVRYGVSATQLNSTVTAAGSQTEHSVTLSNLTADTQYYYSVGNSAGALEGGSTEYSFTTAPTAGTAKPTRIWVIGDSGTGNSNARAVRDAYKTFTGSTATDLWLMLGDNAYNSGTDSEYQTAVFDTYPELLQQVVVWPVLGNHDGFSSDSATESGPYYDIFNLPRAGEAGGLATGTEAYYAFDYGNIHFIALDSFETDRSVDGAMLTWLENDLLANDKPWVIAFWHHPPYTKGSHNSDTESRLIDMRQNALPILENYGVDLVLTGHSHAYERSMLIDGHYGHSTSLTSAMILNSGSGQANTVDGVYSKTNGVAVANEGAVYAVAGSSGKISGGSLNHPAMYISLNLLGSMVIDVNGNQMDTVFLDSSGIVQDHFTLIKGSDTTPPSITSVTSDNSGSVLVEFSEAVDQSSAETISNYTINHGINITNATLQAGSRSVKLNTSTLLPDKGYILTVNQVTDNALNPIKPSSQAKFIFLSIQSISFQNGVWPGVNYQGAIDTYISENSATTNYGSATDLQTDGDNPNGTGRDLYALMRWDINAIPQGAVIQSATIELNVFNTSQNSYLIYELFTDWFETEASWNQSENGQPWAVAGAKGSTDRGTTFLGDLSATSTGLYTINLNTDGLNTLQNWVSGGGPNYGFIIASPTSRDGIDFSSSNTSTPSLRPKLNVTYSVPGGSNDSKVPTVPSNLVSTATTVTSATLNWGASSDNIGIAGYKLFRDTTLIADLNATSFFDDELQAGSTYLYSVRAYDFAGNESANSTVLSVTTPRAGSIYVRIIQSTDDAEERSDGSMYINSTDLEMASDGGVAQTVGMRFTNIRLPSNATILNAYVQFEVDETNSRGTFLTIHGEDVASSVSFGSTNNNITARPRTSASVTWNPVPWTVENDQTLEQRTPNLANIIEEIVARPNWQLGNDLSIIISGTGKRNAESFDGEPAAAPLLYIEYALDPSVNQNSIDVRIDESSNDAEERSDGSMYISSTDLELTTDDSLVQTVGMRFTNIQLPATATILRAHVQFEADETNSGSTFLTIHGEDVADSTSFEPARNNITSRPLTSASVLWRPDPWTVENDQSLEQRTPDLSNIIEEIVARPNWQIGNDIAIIISGTGKRTAESYDGEPAAAPLLHIEYTLDSSVNEGSIDVRIAQSTDDAEERSDGKMYINSSDLELTTDGSLVQTVGMRFTNIELPPNAIVLNAYVQFEVDETNSGSTGLIIQGEDVADSIGFVSASNNITSRARTSASVLWSPAPWTIENEHALEQRTPDLSIVIEEIVTRPNWQMGNDISIIISGTGKRTAESYDGDASAAPLLHIEYTLDPSVTQGSN